MRHSLKKQRNEAYFERAYDELVSCIQMEEEGKIELYYFDESGFSQKSNLPYGWSEKGVSIECTAYKNSKKFNVLGFLSRQGKVVYHEVECIVNTDIVIEAFEKFAKELSGNKKTIVYVDNAPTHTSEKFINHAWLWEGQYNLEVRYLPSYSPELNAIEILWRKIKYERLSISAYETYSKLKKAVETILDDYHAKYEITFKPHQSGVLVSSETESPNNLFEGDVAYYTTLSLGIIVSADFTNRLATDTTLNC